MPPHSLHGGCHCGSIRIEIELTRPASSYQPRACDCDFCRKHGAAYLSDPAGTLRVHARPGTLGRYRQGAGLADFLFCRTCAVLVGVSYEEDGRVFATVNIGVLEGDQTLVTPTPVSPRLLAAEEKVARWKAVWFADVSIVDDKTTADGLPTE